MGGLTQDMKTIPQRNCKTCDTVFYKAETCSVRAWEGAHTFCSTSCSKKGNKNRLGISYPAWNKGIPMTEEGKQNLRDKLPAIARENGNGKWMLGKKQSPATRQKKSEAAKKRVLDGVHNFYIDGRTPLNASIRHSLEYRTARETAMKRDDFTCQECGLRGVFLNVDHIKPFAYYPELRFELSNLRTLCVPCHEKTPTYKGRALAFAK